MKPKTTVPRFYVSFSHTYQEYIVRDRLFQQTSGKDCVITGTLNPNQGIVQDKCDRLNRGLDFGEYGLKSYI